jgi:hypothetical protein
MNAAVPANDLKHARPVRRRPRVTAKTVMIAFCIGVAVLWIAVSALLVFEIQ